MTSSAQTPPPSRPAEPSAWAALAAFGRGLYAGEEATAATEMVILLPVYILFLIGLFSIGNLMIVRQALVTVTRNQAWTTENDGGPMSISGPYRGELRMEVESTAEGFKAKGGQIARSDLGLERYSSPPSEASVKAALGALNNKRRNGGGGGGAGGKTEPFVFRSVRGTYRYDGLLFGDLPSLSQTTRAAVLLPTANHKRDLYDPNATGNASMAAVWRGDGLDPSLDKFLPLSPMYRGYITKGDGLWELDARVRGNVESEHSYFEGLVR